VSRTYGQDFTELADRYLLLGGPERIRDRLEEFADAGVRSVLLQPAGGRAVRERTIGIVSDEVIPRLLRD
jgi:alkanesulfonate monooxygenase SsuD/methylene tetrahydromethanopterin reductase-like flavin-dependent oxidoreductase (luciferase family)